MDSKVSDSFKTNDLVFVAPEALTYSMVNLPKPNRFSKVLGIIIKQVEKRAKPTGNVNFDNAALYYIMTTLGCLTVFEFDLEAVTYEYNEKNCSN